MTDIKMHKKLILDLNSRNLYVTKFKLDNILTSHPWDDESAERITYAIGIAQNLLTPALNVDFYKIPEKIIVKMISATGYVIDSITELENSATGDKLSPNGSDYLITNLEKQVKNLFPVYFHWVAFFKKAKNQQEVISQNTETATQLEQLRSCVDILHKEIEDSKDFTNKKNKELEVIVKSATDSISMHNEEVILEFLHEGLYSLDNENVDPIDNIDGEHIKDWLFTPDEKH